MISEVIWEGISQDRYCKGESSEAIDFKVIMNKKMQQENKCKNLGIEIVIMSPTSV